MERYSDGIIGTETGRTDRLTMTFETQTSALYATHCLVALNNYAKYHEDLFMLFGDIERKRCSVGRKPDGQTDSYVTLTFETHTSALYATHYLVGLNNYDKHHENLLMLFGDIERK